MGTPERVYVDHARRPAVDWPALVFAALPAPVLGAALTAVCAVNFKGTLAWLAFLSVAPGATLAFARRRGAGWWAVSGYALLALAITACWLALMVVYMVWEIGNDWEPMRN